VADRPRMKRDQFPVKRREYGGVIRQFRTVTCDKCGHPAELMESSGTHLPPDVVAKKFLQRGWALNGMNVCPRCQAGKKPMAPAARRAAFCRIAAVEKGMQMEAAESPREATAVDKRRIREALETHYDEDAERYRQSFSDKAVAAKLDVPPAWVTAQRVAGGYGPDRNESGAQRSLEIEALGLELGALQTELLARFDAFEKRLAKLVNSHG
jgi:hypothetical protein